MTYTSVDLAKLDERIGEHTQLMIAANKAYGEWSQLRVSAVKILKRMRSQEGVSENDVQRLAEIVEWATFKVKQIEDYMTAGRTKSEQLQNKRDAMTGESYK